MLYHIYSPFRNIRTLNNKLQYIKSQGMWITSNEKKLDIEGDMAGLKLAMNNMPE